MHSWSKNKAFDKYVNFELNFNYKIKPVFLSCLAS